VARGYFSESLLAEIHQKLRNDLAQHGAHIDAIYYCPHHPDEGCECRKPKPKLAYQAIADLGIDPGQSYVIGDRLMDIQLARAIGSKSVLIANDLGISEIRDINSPPDYIALDFGAAVKWIIKQTKD
jgi:D-glycero-D-manno-heptose 1,7-bisphosphate phosphatase